MGTLTRRSSSRQRPQVSCAAAPEAGTVGPLLPMIATDAGTALTAAIYIEPSSTYGDSATSLLKHSAVSTSEATTTSPYRRTGLHRRRVRRRAQRSRRRRDHWLGPRLRDARNAEPCPTVGVEASILIETSATRRTKTMLARCAWCRRFRLAGRWVDSDRDLRIASRFVEPTHDLPALLPGASRRRPERLSRRARQYVFTLTGRGYIEDGRTRFG